MRRIAILAVGFSSSLATAQQIACLTVRAEDPTTIPSTAHTRESDAGPTSAPASKFAKFIDKQDGYFDVSGFLATPHGFLPVAMPITEPAVGLGLGVGLTFFHDKPQVVAGANGAPSRVIMPSTTVLFGAATENGTWGAGVGHLGVWNEGRVRYVGGFGFAEANLNWYGRGSNLGGRSISYTNDIGFLIQRITFQLGDSNFFIGPQYLFLHTNSQFGISDFASRIPEPELDSQTSGIGIDLSYDSLDQPFSPTRGVRGDITYMQFGQWLGGDFDYGQLQTYGIMYTPVTEKFVIGLHVNGAFNFGDGPFYTLPSLSMRGVPMGRYVDNNAVYAEMELRYDIAERWTVLGFGGVGRVADTIGDLFDADDEFSYGAGFRYLIAREYGLRMGLDIAHGDDDWTVYIGVGTGWIRP